MWVSRISYCYPFNFQTSCNRNTLGWNSTWTFIIYSISPLDISQKHCIGSHSHNTWRNVAPNNLHLQHLSSVHSFIWTNFTGVKCHWLCSLKWCFLSPTLTVTVYMQLLIYDKSLSVIWPCSSLSHQVLTCLERCLPVVLLSLDRQMKCCYVSCYHPQLGRLVKQFCSWPGTFSWPFWMKAYLNTAHVIWAWICLYILNSFFLQFPESFEIFVVSLQLKIQKWNLSTHFCIWQQKYFLLDWQYYLNLVLSFWFLLSFKLGNKHLCVDRPSLNPKVC